MVGRRRGNQSAVWEEFYRFVPKNDPQIQVHATKGIEVDVSHSRQLMIICLILYSSLLQLNKSKGGNIFLTRIDFDTEGLFKCEVNDSRQVSLSINASMILSQVSAEAPSFQTISKQKFMKVLCESSFVLKTKN